MPQNDLTPDQLIQQRADQARDDWRVERGARPYGADQYQRDVGAWITVAFGKDVACNVQERGDRFLEEALELLQATGYDRQRIQTLVNYTWGRPVGQSHQEVGGVMVTLAALCTAIGVDMAAAGKVELTRCWGHIEKIQAKQNAKRDLHSPLPGGADDKGLLESIDVLPGEAPIVAEFLARLRGEKITRLKGLPPQEAIPAAIADTVVCPVQMLELFVATIEYQQRIAIKKGDAEGARLMEINRKRAVIAGGNLNRALQASRLLEKFAGMTGSEAEAHLEANPGVSGHPLLALRGAFDRIGVPAL